MKFLPKKLFVPLLAFFMLAITIFSTTHLLAQENESTITPFDLFKAKVEADRETPQNFPPQSSSECIGGMASTYPCNNVHLMSVLSLADIGGGSNGNDIWGWTDPASGKEYAIMGRNTGTAFVDISDPENPIYLGNLPTRTTASLWRDVKVYNNHAFIVSEAGGHGMQVFDLTLLAAVTSPPVTFGSVVDYTDFGNAHNIVVNEDSGYAYAVGTGTCSGGLHIIDVSNPQAPTNAGCFSADGYTHDAQCVNYHGPDTDYANQEICFNSNTDTLTIANVTDKSNTTQISRTGYTGSGYTHQGWVTEDHQYYLLNDEADESNFGHNTKTYIWDITDLDNPIMINTFLSTAEAIDHNLYILGNRTYQSNYRAGLRILDSSDVANGNLSEVGYFDVYPGSDAPSFSGTWSNYPYFDSGSILISTFGNGLFVVKESYSVGLKPSTVSAAPGTTATHQFTIINRGYYDDAYNLAISDNSWPVTLISPTPISITAGTMATVTVEVMVPTSGAKFDSFNLNANSVTSPTTSTSTQGTTESVVNPDVSLFIPTPTLVGDPGTAVTHTITLTNSGDYTDTFNLSLSGYTWPSQLLQNTPTVAANTAIELQVVVDIPAIAFLGGAPQDTFTLTAGSTLNPAVTDAIMGTTITALDADITIPTSQMSMNKSGATGTIVAYEIDVTNNGTYTDTFNIDLSDYVWDTSSNKTAVGPLAVGATDTVIISVMVGPEESDHATVTFTSTNNPNITRQVSLTTASSYRLYLPLIQNN